jgi:RNA polymerase sigma factor (sigma-70 family)
MKDYELQIAIKNAPLLNLMRMNGIESLAQLKRLTDTPYQSLINLANLKISIFGSLGEPRQFVIKLADFFGVLPENLAPEAQHYVGLEKNRATVQVNAEQMFALTNQAEINPDALLEHQEMIDFTHEALDKLTVNQRKVLTMRFMENKTLKQCGEVINASTERVRQIEQKALRILGLNSQHLYSFIRG